MSIRRDMRQPYFRDEYLSLLRLPFVQKIVLLLRYLATEEDMPYSGGAMLFEILHFDRFAIPPIEIAQLSAEVADRQFGVQKTSLRRLLVEKAARPPQDLFDPGLPEGLKMASHILEMLIAEAAVLPLQMLLERCIRDAGILETGAGSEEKTVRQRGLSLLSDFVHDACRRDPGLRPEGLLQLIGLLKDTVIAGPEGLPEGIAGAGSETGAGGSGASATAPRVADRVEGSELQGELADESGRSAMKARVTDRSVGHETQAKAEPAAPKIAVVDAPFVGRMLDKFVMNVSALNNYLRCPLEFYYKNIVRVPSPKNEAAEFGSAVHFALQTLFEKMRTHVSGQFPSREEMIGDFQSYMHQHRALFTPEAFTRRMEYGPVVLGQYYDRYVHEWSRIVVIERSIRNVSVRGVPLKGRIDKLEFNGRDVNIVDYKTGDIGKAMGRLSPPSVKTPHGGDYWRQAVFYKILIDSYERKDWKVVSTEFDFVEPDKEKQYQKIKIIIRPEDITTVTQQIIGAWHGIRNREFYTGCGLAGCHWCNFVKANNLSINIC